MLMGTGTRTGTLTVHYELYKNILILSSLILNLAYLH